jgi:class 3 adenylate cyclase
MSANKPPLLKSVFRADALHHNPQRGNLRVLSEAVQRLWALGRNMMLCWTPSKQGVEVLVVPHTFLASFTEDPRGQASSEALPESDDALVRYLIAGHRYLSTEEFNRVAERLGLLRQAIRLPIALADDSETIAAVDEIIARHSISFVERRAVVLFDIAGFSRYSPFEQTSQLSSLAYVMNTAAAMLGEKNQHIDIASTTTGDGFYVWNRSRRADACEQLFQFMLLVIAQNAAAQRVARSGTVPELRSAFHVGSHYEFYQSQGMAGESGSYIVGDVTIELARMLEKAAPGQIYVGDFNTEMLTSLRDDAYGISVDSPQFVERSNKNLPILKGCDLGGHALGAIHCYLSGESGVSAGQILRRFKITDKHGFSRIAYNLRCNVHFEQAAPLIIGLQDSQLPKGSRSRRSMLERSHAVTTLNERPQQLRQ